MSILGKLLRRRVDRASEMIDIDGQAEALLTNRAYEYVSSRPGFTGITHDSYRNVFTVRKREIEEYIEKHQIVLEDYGEKYHWLRMFPREDKWIVSQFYPPEKAPGVEVESTLNTYREARAYLLERLLINTQSGIRF
jgi:hypothetical protein